MLPQLQTLDLATGAVEELPQDLTQGLPMPNGATNYPGTDDTFVLLTQVTHCPEGAPLLLCMQVSVGEQRHLQACTVTALTGPVQWWGHWGFDQPSCRLQQYW